MKKFFLLFQRTMSRWVWAGNNNCEGEVSWTSRRLCVASKMALSSSLNSREAWDATMKRKMRELTGWAVGDIVGAREWTSFVGLACVRVELDHLRVMSSGAKRLVESLRGRTAGRSTGRSDSTGPDDNVGGCGTASTSATRL